VDASFSCTCKKNESKENARVTLDPARRRGTKGKLKTKDKNTIFEAAFYEAT
jgi:hypothetical protein